MLKQDYRVVISETFKENERRFSPLKAEKEKSEKNQRAKWLNLLFKINKIIEEK